jgi:putative salt-induced outer membrane protein
MRSDWNRRVRAAMLATILAGAANAAVADPLTGEGELGLSVTRGNSESETLTGKAKIEKKTAAWTHTAAVEAVKTATGGITNAQRYVGTAKSARDLNETIYLFGTGRYDADKFSGFSYQTSAATGVGFHVIKTDPTILDLEAGVGYRVDRTLVGEVLRDAILRTAAKFSHKLTANTTFTEDALVELGNDNTYSESVTGLKVDMNSNLALRLGLTVKNNSDPPAGKKSTDSYSTVTLVFKF